VSGKQHRCRQREAGGAGHLLPGKASFLLAGSPAEVWFSIGDAATASPPAWHQPPPALHVFPGGVCIQALHQALGLSSGDRGGLGHIPKPGGLSTRAEAGEYSPGEGTTPRCPTRPVLSQNVRDCKGPLWVTQSRLHTTLTRRVLNISRERDSTASLGSLGQGSVTLRGKFFLMFLFPAELGAASNLLLKAVASLSDARCPSPPSASFSPLFQPALLLHLVSTNLILFLMAI